MLFWLKKTLTIPFLPLYFTMLVGSVGLLLLWSGKFLRVGRALVTIALLSLLAASNKGFSAWLMRPLESRYAPLSDFDTATALPAELQRCQAIVVLGGGHADGTALSHVNQLSSAALSRLAEAIRLSRLLPQAQFIVSGNNDPRYPTHAKILEETSITLGVEPGRIVRMDEPRDTEDEANGIARRLGNAPFVLVTSAWHMPRAVALCEKAGLHPYPAPADFVLKVNPAEEFSWLSFDLEALERSTKAVHEYLGRFWGQIRQKA